MMAEEKKVHRFRHLKIGGQKTRLHKAYVNPKFNEPTVITSDQFKYVELWLSRKRSKEALVYWNQARNFYHASIDIPSESKPLISYYMMLNAAKALLVHNKIELKEAHGAKGETSESKLAMANETIKIQENGVIPSLFQYFDSSPLNKSVDLKTILYNLPFIHRAFTITFRSLDNLFIPIQNPVFALQRGGPEGWFRADIKDVRYRGLFESGKQRGWELLEKTEKGFSIRRKGNRFRWHFRGDKRKENQESLRNYHRLIRRDIKYIFGSQRLWYYKRNDKIKGVLTWPTPGLIMLAMHRMSELCRYEPKRLNAYFDSQYNWLLHEFISLANDNFMDMISCEITGEELMMPTYRG